MNLNVPLSSCARHVAKPHSVMRNLPSGHKFRNEAVLRPAGDLAGQPCPVDHRARKCDRDSTSPMNVFGGRSRSGSRPIRRGRLESWGRPIMRAWWEIERVGAYTVFAPGRTQFGVGSVADVSSTEPIACLGTNPPKLPHEPISDRGPSVRPLNSNHCPEEVYTKKWQMMAWSEPTSKTARTNFPGDEPTSKTARTQFSGRRTHLRNRTNPMVGVANPRAILDLHPSARESD